MRTQGVDRAFVATVLVGSVLWFSSGAVNAFLVSVGPGRLVGLVFPPTVPYSTWQLVAPWNAVLPALSVVLFAAVFAFALALLRRAAGPALVVVWFAAIVASALTVAIVGVASSLSYFPPTGFVLAATTVQDPLAIGALWGLVCGWMPALVAVLIGRRAATGADTATATARRPGAVLPAVVAVLATLAVGGAMFPALAAGVVPVPVAEPQPEYTPPPVPLVGGGDLTIDPTWCDSDELVITDGGGDAATGHRALSVVATNVSDAHCVLVGYPDYVFANDDTGDLGVTVFRGGSFMTADAGAESITLEPGARAVSSIGWNANSTAGGGETNTLYAAAYTGAERTPMAVELDIVAGSTVAATAWELIVPSAG